MSRSSGGRTANISGGQRVYGGGRGLGQDLDPDSVRGDPGFGDVGGASRFFYCPKASGAERNAGLDSFPEVPSYMVENGSKTARSGDGIRRERTTTHRNSHPTVKPIDMCRWLAVLVTPPGGVILDPFAGSGSIGCGARIEGFRYIGVEREPKFADLARRRIEWWERHPQALSVPAILKLAARPAAVSDDQLSLM